jgi:hypothetical protein
VRRFAVLALLASAACGRIGFDGAATVDADVVTDDVPVSNRPTARVATTSFWTDWFGMTFGTPGMSKTGYEISTAGVVDGELLLIVACIDNGSDTVWPDPLGPGYTQIHQQRWGSDGQTCAINWKIAASEPATYTGTYGPGIVSGSAVIALVAIRNASSIGETNFIPAIGTSMNPVVQVSSGVTTTQPDALVLYISIADWECFEVTDVTITTPTGFSRLFISTDRGEGATKDWTIFEIAQRDMPAPGPTGTIMNTATSTGTAACKALPWTGTLVINR